MLYHSRLAPLRSSWLAFVLASSASFLPAETTLPPGKPLVNDSWSAVFSPGGEPNRYHISHQPDGGPDRNGSFKIATLQDESPPWAISRSSRTTTPVEKGDVALVSFAGRASKVTHETGLAQVRLVVQERGGAYAKAANMTFSLTGEWQTFYLPARFPSAFEANEAEISFGFGFLQQTVEIANLQAIYYGKTQDFADLPVTRPDYLGRQPGAPWRRAALERIEQIRKGALDIRILDAAGKPLPDAVIELRQTRSAFDFGIAVNTRLLVGDGPNSEPYRQRVLELFNSGSPENDLKWPFWAGERSGFDQATALAALQWMKNHDLRIRGHALVWPGLRFLPRPIVNRAGTPQESEIPQLVLAHIDDITTATQEFVTEWDVLNEPFNNHLLMDLFGDEIMVDWFKAARKNLPHVPLYLNDWGNHSLVADPVHVKHFVETTRFLLENGAEVNGLGLQGHIGANPTPPEHLIQTLDHYEKELALPVRITEFDITTADEEMQADYTRDFMIAAFSHSSVVGVQLWGFWEGAHWKPEAALYRLDWTEKPNGRVFRELLQTWRTDQTGRSDPSGRFQIRGFHGDYELVVRLGDEIVAKTAFSHRGDRTPVTIHLP